MTQSLPKKALQKSGGQILTSVIVFVAFGLSVIALSAILTIINLQNSMKNIESLNCLSFAESGVEEALLNLLRDPSYTGGTFSVDSAEVIVTVSTNAGVSTINSKAIYNGFTRSIVATASIENMELSLLSWSESL